MGSEALATGPLDLAFPFSRDARADRWLRDETRRLVESALTALGPSRVRSVIVAGSLARGEGGVGFSDGAAFPVADLDLYVVARSIEDVAALRDARHAFFADCERGGLRADVGIASDADLAAMPDTIANFSLGRDGKTVFGDASALSLVRKTDPARIPREDAINLVLNRAAEELAALRDLEIGPASRALAIDLHYRGIKTVADVGLAVLLCRGVCEPAYEGRGERIATALAEDSWLARTMPADFAREVTRACEWKLAPRIDEIAASLAGAADTPAGDARALDARIAAVRGFCRWYTGGAADPLASLATSEPLPRAARSWVRYARRSRDERGALVRRLGGARLRPTPRLSVQLAALALYLDWNGGAAERSSHFASRLLPARPRGNDRATLVDATIAAWEHEIMNRRRR